MSIPKDAVKNEYGSGYTTWTSPPEPVEKIRPPVTDDYLDADELQRFLGSATFEAAVTFGLPATCYQCISDETRRNPLAPGLKFYRSRAAVTKWRAELIAFAKELKS